MAFAVSVLRDAVSDRSWDRGGDDDAGRPLSQQQRPRYYLPLVPPASLLIGWWFAEVSASSPGRWLVRNYLLVVAALGTVGMAAWAMSGRWPSGVDTPGSAMETAVLAAAFLTLIAALTVGMRRRRPGALFPLA